ncbi:FG-GAP repeat domain-containing protein [Aquirufa sp. ROCK2-A2]
MRSLYLISFLFLFASCYKEEITPNSTPASNNPVVINPTPVNADNYTLQITEFNFTIPNVKTSPYGFGSELSQATSSTILYSLNGTQHIISNPSDLTPTPPLHFMNKSGTWVLEGYYPEAAMDLFRNYVAVDNNGTYAIANHGNETDVPRPFGDLFVVKTKGDKLEWTKVSKSKNFYHSVGVGDLTGDGLFDVVGLNMGEKPEVQWYNNLHAYTQNADKTFSEARNLITYSGWKDFSVSAGAVLLFDLDKDGRSEIIRATYGAIKNEKRHSILILAYNPNTKVYDYKSTAELGVFENPDRGATSIKPVDVDKDGDFDLAIASEGFNYNGVQIWINDGKGTFKPSQNIEFTHDVLQFREFETVDIDNDGDLDILLNPFQNGKLFRPNTVGNDPGLGIQLQNCILVNESGTYKTYSKSISIPKIQPGFMKGAMLEGKLHYIGFEDMHINSPTENRFKLLDISIQL